MRDLLGLRNDDTAGIRARLLDAFADWSPSMLQMITDNDGPYVDRPLFALPVPHIWQHSPTVTLLGDAAHLMPPLGVGANLAMLDAYELALALAGSPTIDEAVRTYENTMLPRSTDTARLLEHGAAGLLERHVTGRHGRIRPAPALTVGETCGAGRAGGFGSEIMGSPHRRSSRVHRPGPACRPRPPFAGAVAGQPN
ncbi:NAD(P)/FAD-dependent oxidoreductase [Kibdelosporangium persicum]|uniref:FAD-dependent oxidoreductase n=1 Tax=Kibdelosporangium persicum TaxID=2698649 RepID=UPI001FE88FF0|nr:FAD-dependent monooxygenase [Kibdelosporangium persicum]